MIDPSEQDASPPPPAAPGLRDEHRRLPVENGCRTRRPDSWWGACLAAGWLVGFLAYFYSVVPGNNPQLSRVEFWRLLHWPFLLLPGNGETPSGWRYFPQRLDLVLVASIILAGAWGLGHILLRLLKARLARRSLERAVFAMGLGLSALSLLTLACGLAGWLSRPFFAGVMATAVAVEILLRLRDNQSVVDPAPARLTGRGVCRWLPGSIVGWCCLAAITPFLLAVFLGSMLPSLDFDVKEYHLQGPKEFFQAGRIEFLPHNVYTSFPFCTEMLSLLAMVLRGDWYWGGLAGKTVLMAFAPLTALALFAAGRRLCNACAGWLAALVFLTTPWTFRVSTIAYAEGGLTFYLFAALLATVIGIQQLVENRSSVSPFFLAGLMAGSAMACKYPALVTVVIPLGAATAAAGWVCANPGEGRAAWAIRSAAVFGLGTAITVGPWLVKNTVETGNPVYPLMYTIFGGRDLSDQLNRKWRNGHRPTPLNPNEYGPNPHNPRELPQRLKDVTVQNDWLSPLLYGLAPLALLGACRRWITGLIWLYFLYLFFAWWGLTHRIDRFWVPMLPVVALLAGIGAQWNDRLIWRGVCGLSIAAAVLFNLGFVISGRSGYNEFLVDLNHAREWSARLTTPDLSYLNQLYRNGNLPADFKLLSVGEAEVFDARFPIVYETVFDESHFETWCGVDQPDTSARDRPLRDAQQIRRTFQENGITHVLVNWQEILRYRPTYGYTDFVTPDRFAQLRQAGVLGPPVRTFGFLELAGLESSKKEQIQGLLPFSVTAEDGESVTISAAGQQLDPGHHKEAARWAPSLLKRLDGQRILVISQIFPVRR